MNDELTSAVLALINRVIYAEIKMRALSSLLIDNGITTEDDIEKMHDYIYQRDFEEIKSELLDLIDEYCEED